MQKGFAPILIVLLIAVLAIGGYFVYTNYSNNEIKTSQNVQTTQTPTPTAKLESTSSATPLTIKVVFEKHITQLMSIPGVVGGGIGECQGKSCIKVFVKTADQATLTKVPNSLEGYKVEIEETGEIHPL